MIKSVPCRLWTVNLKCNSCLGVAYVEGLLAFTFHHSEDKPWVTVLESLFGAGFYLVATFPVRSDETNGDGDFGSQKIEFDIVHVCRKPGEDTKEISWARLRRQILQDVKQLQDVLEHHQQAGLAEADLQVIRRGVSLLWDPDSLNKVCKPRQVASLRHLLKLQSLGWPENDLGLIDETTLVIAGLEVAIDALPHQVVLTHRIATSWPRRFLIADEVGLGKAWSPYRITIDV